MKINCGACGGEDRVWAAKDENNRLPATIETGWNRVQCRSCKAEGYIELTPACYGCGGSNMWRYPNRSMNTNCRRWLCRDCWTVSEIHTAVTFFPSDEVHPVKVGERDCPPCSECGAPTYTYDHARMVRFPCTRDSFHVKYNDPLKPLRKPRKEVAHAEEV